MSKPPIEYTVETVDPSGNRYRWGPSERDPGDIPQSVSFSTRPGKGFDACTLTLSRRIDAEYPDLAIEHECRVIGAEGQILWEGIIGGAPRERTIDGGDSVTVQGVGFMDDAARQRFCELMIDRDHTRWEDLWLARRIALITSGYGPTITGPQSFDGGSILLSLDRLAQSGAGGNIAGMAYISPSPVGRVEVWVGATNRNIVSNWRWVLRTSVDEFGNDATDDVKSATPVGGDLFLVEPTNGPRWVQFFMHYTGAAGLTSDAGWAMNFRPVVHGDHGLERRSRSDGGPDGLYVSDMLRYLWGKYYPQADLSGIEETTYPVPQAVWHEATTLPDATADLNKWHGWKWGMWENRKLEFAPNDFTKADWQVRSGQDGVEVQAAGDSTEAVFNGVDLTYTDFGGQQHFLSARDVVELRDESPWIAANQWGRAAYLDVQISDPCEEADAIAIARVILAGQNRAKRPSVITVPYHIRNGAGDWRPVEEVRSGQTIAVTNQVGDAPRLITATDVQDHRLTISTDDAIADVETYLERLGQQRALRGV